MNPPRTLIGVPLLTAALALSGCGLSQESSASTGKVAVVASFYPLQFATQQIGGSHVAVTSLTKPGAEPHDIELTPRDVGSVSKARLVVFEKGLQGAVDSAVESQGGDRGLDVAPAAKLDLKLASGSTDPHFWLDPQRYAAVATAISARLSIVDPAHKADYEKNARVFQDRLTALSAEFTTGLANCHRRDIVTSHSAFSYLARRFGMKQMAINGISPEQEPKAAALAAVSTYARANGVTTIYAETLVSPAIAATVARESGATMATLDPIEGLTSASAGADYFGVMRSNLKALQAGQGCS
jgi:zinc transport system substrate-binding protein